MVNLLVHIDLHQMGEGHGAFWQTQSLGAIYHLVLVEVCLDKTLDIGKELFPQLELFVSLHIYFLFHKENKQHTQKQQWNNDTNHQNVDVSIQQG